MQMFNTNTLLAAIAAAAIALTPLSVAAGHKKNQNDLFTAIAVITAIAILADSANKAEHKHRTKVRPKHRPHKRRVVEPTCPRGYTLGHTERGKMICFQN